MYLESDNGFYLTQVALPDEDYEYVLAEQIQTMQRMAVRPTVIQQFNETDGAFYIYWNETLVEFDNTIVITNRCYCLTSNCNSNLTECLRSGFRSGQSDTSESYNDRRSGESEWECTFL